MAKKPFPDCLDCGKRLGHYRSKRCKSCGQLHLIAMTAKPICAKCGKQKRKIVSLDGVCGDCRRPRCTRCSGQISFYRTVCIKCIRADQSANRVCACGKPKAKQAANCRACYRDKNAALDTIVQDGYIYVLAREHPYRNSCNRVAQHRLVMEEMLGRYLLPHEQPHHISGQRDDNRPCNLELWDVSQPAGQRVSDKIAWAIEYLENHGYTVGPPNYYRAV